VTPGDVLDVINFINGQAAAEGEGESPGEPQTNAAASVVPELEFASDASSRPGTSDSRPGDSESAADVIGSRPGGLRTPAIPQRAAISPVRPLYRYRAADRGVESDRNLEDWEDLLTEIAAFQVSSFLAGAF
jgi:hypothetical protein